MKKTLLVSLILIAATSGMAQYQYHPFPNPAKEYVELHWDGFAEGLEDELTISMYTLTGTLVYVAKVSDYMKNTWLLNTKEFETGLYLISINNGAGKTIFSEKLSIIK